MENHGQLTPEKKVYSIGWMAFGAYLGGPLAGAYFLSKNFEFFGDKGAARTSLLIGALGTLFLFGGLAFIPEPYINKIPNSVLPLLYTSIIYTYATTHQKKNIDVHKAEGGKVFSGWRITGISLLCLVPAILTLLIAATIAVSLGM